MKYFAYGANINRHSMAERCPQARPVKRFALQDWELQFRRHATIVPKKGATVHGVLWDITEECEESLDIFEGFPVYYTKKNWTQDEDQFFFYEMTPSRKGFPSDLYIENIAEGYSQWRLPLEELYDVLIKLDNEYFDIVW